MNRFARIMQVLGGLGVALLAVVWAQGFLVRDDTPELARHSTLALAAALLCVLPRFWTIAYLLLAARGRAAQRRSAAGEVRQHDPSARLRRQAWIASILALGGLAGSFALAGAILLRRSSPLGHALAGALAVTLQVVALVLERRALLADAAEMQALAVPPSTPGAVASSPS